MEGVHPHLPGEPSKTSATTATEQEPVPTADSQPATKTVPESIMDEVIALELEPHRESDKVCESAPTSIEEDILVEYSGIEGSPVHTPTAEGKLCQVLIQCFEELENIIPQSLSSPPFLAPWLLRLVPRVRLKPSVKAPSWLLPPLDPPWGSFAPSLPQFTIGLFTA